MGSSFARIVNFSPADSLMIEPTNPVFLKRGEFSINGTSFDAEGEKPFISISPFWIFMFVSHVSFGSDWVNLFSRGSFAGYCLSMLLRMSTYCWTEMYSRSIFSRFETSPLISFNWPSRETRVLLL